MTEWKMERHCLSVVPVFSLLLLAVAVIALSPQQNHPVNHANHKDFQFAQYSSGESLENFQLNPHNFPSSFSTGWFSGADSMLLIGSIDGSVSAFTGQSARHGRPLWTLNTNPGPLVSSSLSKIEVVRDGLKIELIPCLDGDLFAFNGDSIEALPVSAESLLSSSFRISDDTMIVGGKKTGVYGVDPKTGRVKYRCSDDGCNTFENDTNRENDSADQSDGTLVIKRLGQIVRAVDIHQGSENWNFSVSSLEITLAENRSRSASVVQDDTTSENLLHDGTVSFRFDTSTGTVFVMSANGATELLRYQLENPITSAWMVENGVVRPLDLLTRVSPFVDPALTSAHNKQLIYIGRFEDQRYIQRASKPYPPLTQEFPQVTFRPLLISANSRTPAIVSAYRPFVLPHDSRPDTRPLDDQNGALVPVRPSDYPFDYGYFISEDPLGAQCMDSTLKTLGGANQGVLSRILDSIDGWMALSGLLLMPVVIGLGWKCIRLPRPLALEYDEGHGLKRQNTTTSSSDKSLTSVLSSLTDLGAARSRFQSDFEVLSELGRGGFGVVYAARNRLNENVYAVKKIRLPRSNAAREKVRREVRVLAKLEHVGVVRFYNAWVELDDMEVPFPISSDSLDHGDGFEPSYLSDDLNSDWIGTRQRHEPSSNAGPLSRPPPTDDTSCEVIFKAGSDVPDDLEESDEDSSDSSGDGLSSSNSTRQSSSSLAGLGNLRKSEGGHGEEPVAVPVGVARPKPQLFIQMELCRVETLKDWLKRNETRNRKHILDVFYQIVCAVEYIHSRGLMHRDLKPSNVLFSLDGTGVKIADFGLVTATDDEDAHNSIIPEDIMSLNGHHTHQVGTRLYMSPELCSGKSYTEKIDIYSLGLIFLELLTPFGTEMERINCLTSAKTAPGLFHVDLGKAWIRRTDEDLLRLLLAVEPDDRPSALELRGHGVFRDLSVLYDENGWTRAPMTGSMPGNVSKAANLLSDG